MAKDKDKIELKPVDEEAEKVRRFVRLHPDAVEEVEDLPPVRVGVAPAPEEDQVERRRIKTRSIELDIGALIEGEEVVLEGQWESVSNAARKLPWGWAVLVAGVFAAGILWSLWAVKRSDSKQELLADKTVKIVENAQEEEEAAERLVTAIEAGVRGFFDSKTPEEMLRFVRHPERTALLMEDHYRKNPLVPVGVREFHILTPLTLSKHASFWVASCELQNNESVQVLVEAVGPGEAKVDWETYVNHQPMPWDDFARSKPGGYTGDFRVNVEPDNYYTHEFSDSSTLTSFRLTALRGEEVLTGYVPRGEALEKEITDLIMQNGGGATPMILRLYVPNNLQSKRGVVVVGMVCSGWTYVNNPEKVGP